MTIIRKIPWTKKPPANTGIDWANPLSKGLVGVFPFWEAGGQPRNIIDNSITALDEGDPSWAVNRDGITRDYDNTDSDSLAVSTTSKLRTIGACTLFFKGYNREAQASSAFNGLAGLRPSGAGGVPWAYNFRQNSALMQFHWRAGGGFAIATATTNLPTDDYFSITCTRPVLATSGKIYKDGLLLNETTGLSAPTAGTANLAIGQTIETGSENWDGQMNLFCIWDRELSESEVLTLEHNPYQIFQPRTQVLNTFVAAGGGGATNPHYVFGHPLYGPFAGPIG